LAVLLVLLLSASTSFAAGFRLPEAGNKANAMGFAFTAQADNPSAIYYNPAGLTQLQGNNIALGVTYVKENGGEFTGSTQLTGGATISETQKDLNFFIPNLYYTYTDKKGDYSVGIGVFAPFGLGQEYQNKDTSWFRNQVTKIDLKTVVINPTVAVKINEVLSVGFGIDYMWGKVDYEKTPVIPASLGGPGQFYADLEGDGDAWGYNFGILVKATRNLKLGFSYRSKFDLDIKDGDFKASNPVGSVPGAFFPMGTTKASGDLGIPATAAFGASYTYDRFTIEADLDWTFWSSYQQLKITNATVPAYSSTAQKNWRDVCAFRTGLEYRVTQPVALRAGFSYDPTPAPAETLGPELPDADRLYYTLGAGFQFGNWTLDVSGIYIDKKDRSVATPPNPNMSGTWKGDAWLAGMDIAYKF
jgi:long-chain fatty acid transport protein